MKIISDFHDYYDVALATGHDDRIIYHRHLTKLVKKQPIIRKREHKDITFYYECGYIGFCGKQYPFVCLHVNTIDDNLMNYCYSIEHLEKVHYQHELPMEMDKFFPSWQQQELKVVSDYKQGVRFLEKQPLENIDKFLENNMPIYYSCQGAEIINPRLQDYGFYRVFDVYTAYQEIEMFIGGVLGNIENNMIDVGEEHRLAGHGYDKYSFRKQKGEKKPRRKGKDNV